jgi:hypothetical protein
MVTQMWRGVIKRRVRAQEVGFWGRNAIDICPASGEACPAAGLSDNVKLAGTVVLVVFFFCNHRLLR